jgi:sulfite exporter TauE/SafE
MEVYISALVLGLMGSFHCVGMCGPIALSLPLRGKNYKQKISGGFLYNIGRTITYSIMGGIFGLIGQGFSMIGFQRWISIIMGSLMILSVILPTVSKKINFLGDDPITGKLRNSIRRLFELRSYGGLFLIGLLNALLPCGLVYMAIAGAIGTGSIHQGVMFMALFGLGTIPMMLAISLVGNAISLPIRKKINKIIPYIVIIIGLIFILRGMSLGIKYLSPPAEKMNPEMHIQDNKTKHM